MPAPQPLEGRQLGDFTIVAPFGGGGQGTVYRARQDVLERDAVIKVAHASGEDARTAFLHEARLASKLSHPYAAHVYAFGAEEGDLVWIAMELVEGTSLDELLALQGPLSVERCVPLVDKIGEVVAAAHEGGIVHRDLKPANIVVVSRAGQLYPKLLDFGIARHGGTPSTGETELPSGTPAYMAPELWRGESGDARTDVYALGATVYELLTGQPPFEGRSLFDVAKGHARMPPPRAGLPVDDVIVRAMAKDPAERYASALEFAGAFRAAAGVAEDHVELPRLDPFVRDTVFADAPHPIAASVARLDQAYNAHQLRDAVAGVARATTRWLALVALACRSRAGADASSASSLAQRLRDLRTRALSDREWLDVAVDAVADMGDAHPIPALRGVVADESLVQELRLALAVSDSATGSDDDIARALAETLPRLGRMLRALEPLFEYQLAVPRGDHLELWSGPGSPRAGRARPDGLTDAHPVLVDARGSLVVSMWPLAVVDAPAPGADRALFLLAGPGRRGARLQSLPAGFERHSDDVWPWFRTELLDVEEASAADADESCPYRGLEAFGPEHAALFFGRERDVDAAVNRLRREPFLAVVGPSGSGKSSFVRAGVVLQMPDDWTTVVTRPGLRPLAALIAATGVDIDEETARERPEAIGEALRRTGTSTVVVIDQFEELFTLTGDAADRDTYAEAIANLARSADDAVRVIITLRDDFLMRAEQTAALRGPLAQGLQLLGTPVRADLLRILVEPAAARGYTFEDTELPAQMVDEVDGRAGALALLSFTASHLWPQRDRHFKRLPRSAYEAVGGVGGALAKHAESTYDSMRGDQRRQIRALFRQLVTAAGTRALLRRSDCAELADSAVLETLITARLLVASESDDGEDRVEIAHEALLREWPRLVQWQRADADSARLRDQLRVAAEQ